MEKQRYFIFFYNAIFDSQNATGNIDIVAPGHFPPRAAIYEKIQGDSPLKYDEIIITGFHEFDENDFIDWNRTRN